jgi:hypothetical protein
MIKVYEIHRYLNDQFQYVVAHTHKYTEEKVRQDVKRMNEMLSEHHRKTVLDMFLQSKTCQHQTRNPLSNTYINKLRILGLDDKFSCSPFNLGKMSSPVNEV